MGSVTILFAKAPRPGNVKTRLLPLLTAQQAADLHSAFVGDTLERLSRLRTGRIELHTDVPTDAWSEFGVPRYLQAEGDLTPKLLQALQGALTAEETPVMIVGSDAPTLPLPHLEALLASQADVAFGPAEDGGFYAIACRRMHASMFEGVAWSTTDTLRQAIQAAEKCGLTVMHGPGWFDVDEPDDLLRLCRDGALPPRTRKWCESWRKLV